MTRRITNLAALWPALLASALAPAVGGEAAVPDPSPIALTLVGDGSRMLVANQTAGSVSLLDLANGRVIRETPTGDMPAGVAASKDGSLGVVTHWRGYDVAVLGLSAEGATVLGRVEVGPEPRGVVVA